MPLVDAEEQSSQPSVVVAEVLMSDERPYVCKRNGTEIH